MFLTRSMCHEQLSVKTKEGHEKSAFFCLLSYADLVTLSMNMPNSKSLFVHWNENSVLLN